MCYVSGLWFKYRVLLSVAGYQCQIAAVTHEHNMHRVCLVFHLLSNHISRCISHFEIIKILSK